MQNLYGAQTILHSKSLCYSTPPERGHLSRTGHIGGYYMLVYTVLQNSCPCAASRMQLLVVSFRFLLDHEAQRCDGHHRRLVSYACPRVPALLLRSFR